MTVPTNTEDTNIIPIESTEETLYPTPSLSPPPWIDEAWEIFWGEIMSDPEAEYRYNPEYELTPAESLLLDLTQAHIGEEVKLPTK